MSIDKKTETLHAPTDHAMQKERYSKRKEGFLNTFGTEPTHYFSASGRSEICGNHTDYNHGKVLACAIDLDAVVAVKATGDTIITIASEKYPTDVIDSNNLEVKEEKKGRSIALLRGVCAKFKETGLAVGGFVGTIQAFVPEELVETYTGVMESLFGKGCCYLLSVRPEGGVAL